MEQNNLPPLSKLEVKETFGRGGSSNSWLLPVAVLVGCVIIAGVSLYNTKTLLQKLDTMGSLTASDQAAQQAAAQQPAAQPSAPAQPTTPVTITARADQPTLGNKNAKVTVVEFGDFQCPFCKQFYSQTFGDLKTKYIDTGKIQYIFRHFPLTQIHVNAQISGVAAECANRQGQFWAYHDLLYTNGSGDGTNLDKASLEKYADQLGLNKGTLGFGSNKFNQCLESNATLDVVNKDQAEGTKDGVTGTPTFYINGKQLVGAQPSTTFEAAIDAALKN